MAISGKSEKSGDNYRDREIAAVWDAIDSLYRLGVGAKIRGHDGNYDADVVYEDGARKLLTKADVLVQELLGIVVQAFSYFSITAAPLNATFRVQIPDDSVDVTTTITALEAGDIHAASELVVDDLNADSTFNVLYIASKPEGCPRVFIHTLQERSGTCNERPDTGDFAVTAASGGSVIVAYDNIKQRGLPSALFPHPDDPTKGTFAITGSVNISNASVADYFSEKGTDPVSSATEMAVNGAITPVNFDVMSNGNYDLVITEIRMSAEDGNIVFSKFLDIPALTNGLRLEIKTKGIVAIFSPLIKTTNDLVLLFNSGGIDTFIHLSKRIVAVFKPDNPFVLKKGSSDYVRFIVQDDLTGIISMEYSVRGYKK